MPGQRTVSPTRMPGQRPIVVGAGGPDGKDLLAAADDEDCFAIHPTGEHPAVDDLVDGNALREVWTGWRVRVPAMSVSVSMEAASGPLRQVIGPSQCTPVCQSK